MNAIRRHVFVADDTATTWDNKPGCAECPLPKDHPVHDVPEVTDEVRDETARRIGEREDRDGR